MELIDSIYDNKNTVGSFLFIAGVLFLLYLFINPANDLIIHIDEHYTLGLIQLPFDEAWKLIVSDVHPPLYYLILMAGCGALNMLHIHYDIVFVAKMLSLFPLLLILIIAVTKIRCDYGTFTMGVFAFAITTMSSCMIEFITVRMYGWAMLFLVMAFIYYGEILRDSNRKSWILFTLFSVLCAYTHYYLIVSLAVLYVLYPLYLYLNKKMDFKENIKKWGLSIVACFVIYLPWILTFINQAVAVKNSYTPPKTVGIDTQINYFTYFVLKQTSHLNDLIVMKILIALFFIMLVCMLVIHLSKFRKDESFLIFSGFAVYILSILIGILILNSTFRLFDIRYILPAITVFWFAIAVLLGKVNTKTLLVIAVVAIIVFGTVGILTTNDTLTAHNKEASPEKYVLSQINNENNVVIYNSSFHYDCYHYMLNNSKEYTLKKLNLPYEENTCTYEKNLTKILEDNPDKDVYIWCLANNKKDIKLPEDIEATKVVTRGKIWLVKLDFADDEEGYIEE
ncbi:MAG: hypothetical protein Q4Q22_04130 [Methanosphaera sp.]|nr:hypothetical protein [Methanosphaera sp.]